MTSKNDKLPFIYFLTNSFFLSSGYSLIFRTSGKDSWISMIIGLLIGLIIMKSLSILKDKKESILSIIYYLFIIFIDLLILRIFITSFFLTNTPGYIITVPLLILCYSISTKGIKTISKVSKILLPISVSLILINMLAVTKDGTLDFFLPILTCSKSSILISSFYFAIFTTVPNLMIFNISKENDNITKNYLISSLFTIVIGSIIIHALGPSLIKVFRFPEYMVLKQLQLFSFIEKIENIVSLVWIFNIFISISLSLYKTENIVEKSNKYILPILVIEILITEYVSINYELVMYIYKTLPVLLLIVGIIYVVSLLINKKNY